MINSAKEAEGSTTLVVSTPGKVLLAGGYLVLDQKYSGLVAATSSRFYTCIQHLGQYAIDTSLPASIIPEFPHDIPTQLGTAGPSSRSGHEQSTATVVIRAGQFPADSSTWVYDLRIDPSGPSLNVSQKSTEGSKNKFVQITLCTALEVAWESIALGMSRGQGLTSRQKEIKWQSLEELVRRVRGSGEGMNAVVLADNDFYSQREQLSSSSLSPTLSSLASLTPFSPLPRPIGQTNKTGLGSSAALVTSLTAGLLSYLGIVSLPSSSTSATKTVSPPAALTGNDALELIHSVAQLSHCSAQGKVGSGFDVSAAVYGTHRYTRFSPSLLAPLLDHITNSTVQTSSSSVIQLSHTLLPALPPQARWDHRSERFAIPKGLRLVLADVDAGTDTPSFISKINAWRAAEPEKAEEVWRGLNDSNEGLGEALKALSEVEGTEGYEEALQAAGQKPINQLDDSNPLFPQLRPIQKSLNRIRQYMRELTAQSGIPVEPAEQQRLLDACGEEPGVLGGGVPGAGGYDAIYLLVIDSESVMSKVEGVFLRWSEMSVCPLSASQSDGGLKNESVEHVRGLREALSRCGMS